MGTSARSAMAAIVVAASAAMALRRAIVMAGARLGLGLLLGGRLLSETVLRELP